MKKVIILIIMIIIGTIALTGCNILESTKPPPTEKEVEQLLEEKYGEEFVVTSNEHLGSGTQGYQDVTGYQAYPTRDENLIFSAFSYTSVGVGPFADIVHNVFDDSYVSSIIYSELMDYDLIEMLTDKELEYDVITFSNFTKQQELMEKYPNKYRIDFYISSDDEKDEICEWLSVELSRVLKKYSFIDNGEYYWFHIELRYEEECQKYIEIVSLFNIYGTLDDNYEPIKLDLTITGLNDEFVRNKRNYLQEEWDREE